MQAEEIDRPGIDVGEFDNKMGGGAGLDEVVPEGAVDGDIGRLLHHLYGFFKGVDAEGILAGENRPPYKGIVVDHVAGLRGQGILVVGVPVFAGLHTAHVEDAVACLHQGMGSGLGEAQFGK